MEPLFTFPFTPYKIQEDFMRELYLTIENGKLGIFESPTGTGKSLSICCGALQWLKDSNNRTLKELECNIENLKKDISSNSNSEDWLQEEYEKIKKNQQLISLLTKLDNIKRRRDNIDAMKSRVAKYKTNSSNKIIEYRTVEKVEESKDNLLDDSPEKEDADLILDEHEDENVDSESDEEQLDETDDIAKIYISSRTHSQLSQFIGEIKRTIFNEDSRVVTLASRQHFCINSDVKKLKNVNLINERCLDLQKSKTKDNTSVGEEGKILKRSKMKKCSGCPYYNRSNINKLKEKMLVDILDMEDLVKSGKELKACPYYASRVALNDAEVVLISHAGVVSAGARSGISLKLDKNVVILDEAHGLTAALEQANSAPVSAKQLSSVKTYLQFYINRYTQRLSSKNLLSLNQMKFVVGKLLNMVQNKGADRSNDGTSIYTLEDFVIKAEIDHLNVRPLVEFCRNSRLAPKLHGFSLRHNQRVLEGEMSKKVPNKSSFETFLSSISKKKNSKVTTEVEDTENNENRPSYTVPHTEVSAGSGLYAVLDFLDMLCDRSENGRVLSQTSGDEDGHLKYLLLNPAEHFAEVVEKCRSVVVAGGTMEPIDEFRSLLTGKRTNDEVTVLRCSHVVPPDNVLGICLSKGPSNMNLNFSYENRTSKQLLDEVGRILRNVCSIVPGGVVCFLPSYLYERTIYDHMATSKLIEHISKKKKIFREPKSAADVDKVLHNFATAVNSKESGNTGALMLSVVGGKLSEGLNFSDDLGRCVIVVGMPYPNIKSPELQEKVNYLNRTHGAGAGSSYYENLCMKAVNQCIGRAVRHAKDYACVLLVDDRYSRPQVTSALPSFVQKSLKTHCTFGPAVGTIAKFFSKHKKS